MEGPQNGGRRLPDDNPPGEQPASKRRSVEFLVLRDAVDKLFRTYRKATDNADGATGIGLSGTISPVGLVEILQAMGVTEEELVNLIDLGAGDGRFGSAQRLPFRRLQPSRPRLFFAGSSWRHCYLVRSLQADTSCQ